MTNIDRVLKSRDITLPTKVNVVKATIFPVTGSMSMNVNKVWEIMEVRRACRAAAHGVAKSQTWLSDRMNESVILSNHLILCFPLLFLPPVFPSKIFKVFSNESALQIRWPKYWNFSISPSNEYSGLISFR